MRKFAGLLETKVAICIILVFGVVLIASMYFGYFDELLEYFKAFK
jgi:uncharacterized membrane protein